MPDNDRPKRLYVNVPLGLDDEAYLLSRGWQPIDVRTLPNKTDANKAETIKAWLEGVRQGSITLDKDIIKLIELEAKAYGLVGTKVIEKPKEPTTTEESVDDLLSMFASKRIVRTPRKRSYGPKGGHPFTHSTAQDKSAPLTGIFHKKYARNHFEELVSHD